MTKPASALTETIAQSLRDLLDGPVEAEQLRKALRLLAKWRSDLLCRTLEIKSGTAVLSGPFKGMDYAVHSAEGARAARLIGAYEASLHPVIEAIVARPYRLIVDVGSAEGYYAIGLARRMPMVRVMARDESATARALCAAMAAANGVADRIEIGGRMGYAEFDICTTVPTLVICDIEGGEAELLDPQKAPGLLAADLLVETHDGQYPGLSQSLAARFAATHDITVIGRKIDDSGLPRWMESLSDLDRLIAVWEWRSGPTPWLWMVKK